MGIHNINEAFTDEEYISLMKVKGDRSWHDLILLVVNIKVKKTGEKKVE